MTRETIKKLRDVLLRRAVKRRATRSSSNENPNRYLCTCSFVSHAGVRTLKADGTVRTSDLLPSSTGDEFIKSITDTVEQRILNTMPVGDTPYRDVQVGDTTVKRKTAVTFRWDGEDLVMDNTETLTESVKMDVFWNHCRIGSEYGLDQVPYSP